MGELSLAEEYILGHYNESAIKEIAASTKAIFRQIFYREQDKANVIFLRRDGSTTIRGRSAVIRPDSHESFDDFCMRVVGANSYRLPDPDWAVRPKTIYDYVELLKF